MLTLVIVLGESGRLIGNPCRVTFVPLASLRRSHGDVDPHERETVLGQSRGVAIRPRDTAMYPHITAQ